jgi:hypothetical protein
MIGFNKALLIVLFVALFGASVTAQQSISAANARNHVGESAVVCGSVASTHFAATTRGRPTFINLGEPYPRQIFTVVIWGSDRPKFGAPDEIYRAKNICVSGTITLYRGVAETIAHNPSQIRFQNSGN